MAASKLMILSVLTVVQLVCVVARRLNDQTGFYQNYAVTWGGDHVLHLNQDREVQLTMNKASGSGFGSKLNYNSGLFHLTIKTPSKDTSGVVTAYYLSSGPNKHDELDFEFLGNKQGKPIILQTNVFANGHGNREQRISLWFDPSAEFHDYKILWNPFQIVFFVDDVPIRVFRNLTSKGIDYPSQPMQVIASLWNGEDWATDGGKAKIDWTKSPFVAQFQGFNVEGCSSLSRQSCSSSNLWWNVGRYTTLTPQQEIAYKNVKKNHMTYDYCSDKSRYPKIPPECQQ